MALPSFKELMEFDVEPFCKKRDGISYLPWAKCKELLHSFGAEEVYFVPVLNDDGHSLRMSEKVFADKNGNENRCYETLIEVHIDDKVYPMTSPVMNGSSPVKDNSMSQQRVWNSMCRSFVKAVAIYTGLGFKLWAGTEGQELDDEDSVKGHDISKVQEKVLEKITVLNKRGMTVGDIASALSMTEEEFRGRFALYSVLYSFEKEIDKVLDKPL